jgi:predicted AAA+ superfamily ATPase
MKSILETCTPRPDLIKGTFNPEIFTASLSQVVDHYRGRSGAVSNLYTDAEQFFAEATFPTDGLRMVLSEVMARLSGDNSVPALHRQESAFGGGKTHMLIALTHLGFRGRELAEAAAPCFDSGVFDPNDLHVPDAVQVVGIAGDEIPVHKPQGVDLVPYTLWGEIAFQIGGEALYRSVEAEATSQAAPGKHFLDRIFEDRRVLLLLDELAQYSARLAAAYPQGAGQLSAFLMALNGYARNHAGIAVVLTLAGQRTPSRTRPKSWPAS